MGLTTLFYGVELPKNDIQYYEQKIINYYKQTGRDTYVTKPQIRRKNYTIEFANTDVILYSFFFHKEKLFLGIKNISTELLNSGFASLTSIDMHQYNSEINDIMHIANCTIDKLKYNIHTIYT